MPFQKGRIKTGGRVAGVSHKAARLTALEIMEGLGHNPIEKMVAIAEDRDNPIEVRAKMESELASYGFPKLKSVEHTGANGAALAVAQVKIEFVHNDQREVSVSTPVPLPEGTL